MKQVQMQKELSPRKYQESIFVSIMEKNALVVLPTGLGKTMLALMLALYNYNKRQKKILFLAPTKPLVEQQKNSFEKSIANKEDFHFLTLTGEVSPTKRAELYKEADFIFSTPQLIENDLINSLFKAQDFSLCIVDEAHRARGNYAYCFVAQQLAKANAQILALTASPGTSKEEIEEVLANLSLETVEMRSYEDEDVKPYVQEVGVEYFKVEMSEEMKGIRKLYERATQKKLDELYSLGYLKKSTNLNKVELLELQKQLRAELSQRGANPQAFKAISLAAALMKLQHGVELFESEDFTSAHSYFYSFFREGKESTKATQSLVADIDFRDAFEKLSLLVKQGAKHPKLPALKDLVVAELLRKPQVKLIIFTQFRDSAQRIVDELSSIKSISPVLFVGQAKKGETKLSQKDQKRIIEEFREGKFNTLVSTSVGEEGLDIPLVDVVIFYEPISSAIRSIQRMGRTGRFAKGRVYVLQTDGTKDIATRFIANAKEKRMAKILKDIQTSQESSLKSYFKKQESEEEEDKNEEIKIEQERDERIQIFIDNRENNDLLKELYNCPELNISVTKLTVGDIQISENIAIERKSKKDFVNSILDKRLFPQLLDLARNFKRPVLILEGEENIFSIRNLHPNVIRSTLSAIAVDLRMPIIHTDSLAETAATIEVIAKRNRKKDSKISLAGEKSALNEDEELERVLSTVPKFNASTAKALLKHFKSIEQMCKAEKKDLEECEGIGKARAKALYEFLRREYKGKK
ncbi:DEAD/DEAH box helicase family protein [Candidatus Woesearchaeota archaeon]|nr:DEAD/DEAH box helicase family protein [Nanoarchaeota archaeon]MCB9370601.1 DEAD/DEAH box helicase family protein [Candidatus Woesearchaeota archaeon]USN43682.1 MAG: DEAD/DEAH box helicase family protein [Candidatus Woesearchaeota archaeon]